MRQRADDSQGRDRLRHGHRLKSLIENEPGVDRASLSAAETPQTYPGSSQLSVVEASLTRGVARAG